MIALLIQRQTQMVMENGERGISPYQIAKRFNGRVVLPFFEINVAQRIGETRLAGRFFQSPFRQFLRFI